MVTYARTYHDGDEYPYLTLCMNKIGYTSCVTSCHNKTERKRFQVGKKKVSKQSSKQSFKRKSKKQQRPDTKSYPTLLSRTESAALLVENVSLIRRFVNNYVLPERFKAPYITAVTEHLSEFGVTRVQDSAAAIYDGARDSIPEIPEDDIWAIEAIIFSAVSLRVFAGYAERVDASIIPRDMIPDRNLVGAVLNLYHARVRDAANAGQELPARYNSRRNLS